MPGGYVQLHLSGAYRVAKVTQVALRRIAGFKIAPLCEVLEKKCSTEKARHRSSYITVNRPFWMHNLAQRLRKCCSKLLWWVGPYYTAFGPCALTFVWRGGWALDTWWVLDTWWALDTYSTVHCMCLRETYRQHSVWARLVWDSLTLAQLVARAVRFVEEELCVCVCVWASYHNYNDVQEGATREDLCANDRNTKDRQWLQLWKQCTMVGHLRRGRGKIEQWSTNTTVIIIVHLPKCTILVLKLTLVMEIQVLLSCRRPPLWVLSSTFVASASLTKGLQRFWPLSCDRCRSLTFTFRNSLCWWSCEHCNNFLSSLWTPLPTLRMTLKWHARWLEWAVILSLRLVHYQRVTTGCNGYQECGCPSQKMQTNAHRCLDPHLLVPPDKHTHTHTHTHIHVHTHTRLHTHTYKIWVQSSKLLCVRACEENDVAIENTVVEWGLVRLKVVKK